jgi:hypothetical protein
MRNDLVIEDIHGVEQCLRLYLQPPKEVVVVLNCFPRVLCHGYEESPGHRPVRVRIACAWRAKRRADFTQFRNEFAGQRFLKPTLQRIQDLFNVLLRDLLSGIELMIMLIKLVVFQIYLDCQLTFIGSLVRMLVAKPHPLERKHL